MIQPDAGSIERRWIRIAGVELSQTGPESSAVRHWVDVQIPTHGGWSLLPRYGVRDGRLLRRWLAQPQPLIGEKEESPVFEDRTAEYAAKVIQPLLRLRQMIKVHKPIVGVQHVIPEMFKQRAVKIVRSGSRHNRDLSTRRASELRSKRRRLDTKLLHRIHRHKAVCPTRSAE